MDWTSYTHHLPECLYQPLFRCLGMNRTSFDEDYTFRGEVGRAKSILMGRAQLRAKRDASQQAAQKEE